MMMLLQAAVEAAKSSSTIFLDGAAIMALISVVGLVARELIKSHKQKKKGNPFGPKPGMAPICIERGEKIVKLETEGKNIHEDLVEMKGDIKALLRRVPPRE